MGLLVTLNLLAAMLGFVAPSASAFGEGTFDSNTVINGSNHFDVSVTRSAAQSFVASGSYLLLSATLRLRNQGDLSDAINITVRTDLGNAPSGTVLAASQFVMGSPGVTNRAIAFPSPPSLTAGQRYWIVATSASVSTNEYEWHHSNANTYPNGQAKTETLGTGWSDPSSPTDMYFVTYGRETEANVTAAIQPVRPDVDPGEMVTFRVYLNNTGETSAPNAWLNDTQLAGFDYVSDTASSAGATTGWPSFLFLDVGNGPRMFDLVVRVPLGVEPGTVLTKTLTLAYVSGTGAVKTAPDAEGSILVGAHDKRLHLDPAGVGPALRLDPAEPTGGIGSQASRTIRKDSSIVFDLDPVLARSFRPMRANVTLFLDSESHDVRVLDINLTLANWNGVTLTPVAQAEEAFTTNPFNDYEPFTIAFPTLNYTFAAGGRIRLTIRNQGSSDVDAILAFNSTQAASRVEFRTTTYVRIDRIELRDAAGPASVWSPRDALVIEANVSDPFGSSEIAGARIDMIAPSGALIVNSTVMALFQTDPSAPSAWKLFRFTLPPPLSQGSYRATIMATEKNGVEDAAETVALVRAPAFTLAKTATATNVLNGDRYSYDLWFNNTGSGIAGRVWVNDSLPSDLTFEGSSDPAAMTGDYNWTWVSLGPGNYRLTINVRVTSGSPSIAYFRNYAFLNYTDEKGFPWPMREAIADVAFRSPFITLSKSSTKTFLHSNEQIVYQIRLQNTGEAAGILWVNDTLPSDLMYVSHTMPDPDGTILVSGNLLYFRFTDMPALATWTFMVTAVAGSDLTRGADLTNVASLNYTNSNFLLLPPRIATWTIGVKAPEIASGSIAIARNQVTPADVITAVVAFTNSGSESARDVWVNLTLDWSLLFLNATHVPIVGGNRVQFTLASVPVGLRTILVNASIRPNVTDHQLMTVGGTITYTDGFRNVLGTLSLDADSVEASVPKITLLVAPGETTVEAGTRVFFNIHQANAGSGVAGDVWLTLQLPAGFSDAKDASNVSGATRTVVGSTYTWHWKNVTPGLRSFPLELMAKTTVLNGSRANLTFHSDYTDANGNFWIGETRFAIANFVVAQLDMVVTPSSLDARAGELISLNLNFRNVGGSAARNIWINYESDPHIEVISHTPLAARPAWGLNWSFTDIQPSEERIVTLQIRIREGTPAQLLIPAAFDAVHTNSADMVVGSVRVVALLTSQADPAPIVWFGIAASGLGLLTVLAVVRRLRTKIEEVFLVYRDGVLLYHLSRSLSADKDEDVLSGMLTAVQEFVRDAFVYGEHRELHQLDFGDYRIMIERGRHLYLAVVYSGKDASVIRKRVRSVLDHIETAYGSVLETWDGDMDKVAGTRDLIREFLLKWKGRSLRGLPGLP